MKAVISFPSFPRRTTRCGYAATVSSTRRPYPPGRIRIFPLAATVARSPREAAEVYPANYWASLIEPPKAGEFPGTGPQGNGINPLVRTQDEFINVIKSCQRCHQLGTRVTRTNPDKAKFGSATAAWDHRVTMGQRGAEMSSFATRMGRQRALQMFANWTDRIEAGEVPPAPPRPRGIERNVVITMWDWNDEYGLVHDEIATDRRNPTDERERADLCGGLDQRLAHVGGSPRTLLGPHEDAVRDGDDEVAADRIRAVSLLRRSACLE